MSSGMVKRVLWIASFLIHLPAVLDGVSRESKVHDILNKWRSSLLNQVHSSEVQLGMSVEFDCSVHNHVRFALLTTTFGGLGKIAWMAGDRVIVPEADGRITILNKGLYSRVRLLINDIRFYDAGAYGCYLIDKHSEKTKFKIMAVYTVRVKVSMPTRVHETSEFTMGCQIKAFADAYVMSQSRADILKVEWRHDYKAVFSGRVSENSTLSKLSLTAGIATEGIWQCAVILRHQRPGSGSRRTRTFIFTDVAITLDPPLSLTQGMIDNELIFITLPVTLIILFVTSFFYMGMSIGILDKLAASQIPPPPPDEEKLRLIIREHINKEDTAPAWMSHYHTVGEEMLWQNEYFLDADYEETENNLA